ncbi:MAG TPA: hypothetical protein VI337_01465 [Nitrospirales bacterium]|nr:hypothetical protein [Nitrospirales bacterium]
MSTVEQPKKDFLSGVKQIITQFEGLAAERDSLLREVVALRQQREDAKRFLDIDREKAELAQLQEEKAGILTTADADAAAIRSRGSLDAQATIEAATQRASELITTAERRGTEILETARQQRERDLETSNSRILNLERTAKAVLDRLTQAHREFLSLEDGHQAARKALLEKVR